MTRTRPLAWLLLGVAAALLVAAVAGAAALRLSASDVVDSYLLTNSAMGVGFAVCGGILAVQRGRNPIGWLLLAAGVAHLLTAASGAVGAYGFDQGWPEPVLRILASLFVFGWPWGICLLLPLSLQLFPDGRPVTPRWRWLVVVTVIAGVGFVAAMSLDSVPVEFRSGVAVRTYLGLPFYHQLSPLWTAANTAPLLGLLGAISGLVVRYRRGDERLRRQLLWLVLALIAAVAVNLPRWIVGDGPILLLLAVPLVPIAITIAILRYQLLDIRLVVSRSLLYLLLTLGVVVAYLGLVALFDALLRGAGAPLVATLLIAILFNPVRVRLQRAVDQLLYGSRSDPVATVSAVGARLAADDLGGVLTGIRETLRLPFATLRSRSGEVASAGTPPGRLETVALTYGGERVGDLLVGVRAGDKALGDADRAVLNLLAAPLAAALHATELAEEVQASRERIVTAREEERRRLHRDLHDGLGPTLTGAGYKADAALNLSTSDPDQSRLLLGELRADIGTAIDDVRRLVYGLRPPALDEVGLIGALRRHCERLPLEVTFAAPAQVPALPAAVEVAAYRIVTEALTNVTRHAAATAVTVTIAVGTEVEVSVVDNGRNGGPWPAGVGLTSIRERAAELGGLCTAGPGPGGGRVMAVLPLEVSA
ncbi:histidine kinase [Hamadaea sp.]|uniref:sensor histidine kinase n=1 Tax=Hamadaea sp. TaxID=2024425 RepID=UPI0025BB8EFB|nr:histidine kinase [Hamadaea sp.]